MTGADVATVPRRMSNKGGPLSLPAPAIRHERRIPVDLAAVEDDRRPPIPQRERAPHTGDAPLPDPAPLVHNLTRCIFEIITGVRDLEQVARWVEPEVLAKMERRLALDRRARGITGRTTIWPRVAYGTHHIERPAEDIVECVTVIRTPARARALAMRLVGIEGRWRATHIALL